MARIRSIKPGFFRHGKLYDAERETGLPLRVAFAGMWTAADREGRFRWEPRELKLDCLPHDDVDFSRVLDALESRGFLVKYTLNDEVFGFIPGWSRHQIVNNKESASSLPNPQNCVVLTREARVPVATLTPLLPNQGEGKGREQEGKGTDSATQAQKAPLGIADFKKDVFTRGLSYLTESNIAEKNARSLLGKWRNLCDDATVMNALVQASANGISEPVPYIEKYLAGKEKRNGMGSRALGNAAGTVDEILGSIAQRRAAE